MKKMLVTGATSFIGTAFLRKATESGWQITAVVRRNSKKKEQIKSFSHVNIIELNMDEYSQLGEIIETIDCFVHLAWDGTRGSQREDSELQKLNYVHSLAAVISVINTGCKRIILAGSQAEYGKHNGIITEDMICRPNTEYGKYKLRLFEEVKKVCTQKNVLYIEPRIFSLYGPGDFKNTLIMDLIRKMQNNEPCDMTEGIQLWDYLYIDDAAEAILMLCNSECPAGAYNIASGDVRPLREYVKELYELLESKSPLSFGTVPYPCTGAVSIEPCITKIQNETGWRAKTTFSEGIKKMLVQCNR